MNHQAHQKPTVEEWLHWSGVIMERLTTAAHVYDKPPHEDIFMPEKNRHLRKTRLIELLRSIHALQDQNDGGTDDDVIAGLTPLFEDVLALLPGLSADMQKLLKSRCDNHCNGRIASEFFRGRESEQEGIGTGSPEHGRLPEVIADLIEREAYGQARQSSAAKTDSVSATESAPHRDGADGPHRFAGRTRISSAGRMD